MNTAGVRELKNRLSEYLRRIHQGEEIFVTDRGRVVAELRQPGREPAEAAYPGLERHARAGKARVGGAHPSGFISACHLGRSFRHGAPSA